MKTTNKETLNKYFSFLLSGFSFELKEIKSYDYALYAKFLSSSVGIYFIYEFRDFIPQIQFTVLKADELKPRPGFYTIRELYKEEGFKLQSFYLDEIMLFKEGKEYKNYFKDVKIIKEVIRISAELVKRYAIDFVNGNEESYAKIDAWLRTQIMRS